MASGPRLVSGRSCSGLQAIIPNGSTAPGNVLPPLAVPMRVITYDTGRATSGGSTCRAVGNAAEDTNTRLAITIRGDDMVPRLSHPDEPRVCSVRGSIDDASVEQIDVPAGPCNVT